MPIWEYYRARFVGDDSELDRLGRLGWELVAITPAEVYVFKRRAEHAAHVVMTKP